MRRRSGERRLEEARAFYARLAASGGGAIRDRLQRAFEAVPRELFLGPGPWFAMAPDGTYVATPSGDPVHLYQNLLFALVADKRINNGEPSLHGQLIGALAPERGDTLLHIGCGTGYYTAILALLAGPAGRVIGYEIEPALAARAAACLDAWDNVEVRARSGTGSALPEADGVYVSAGATRPDAAWLDALKEGGRLVFPLSGAGGFGVTLKVVKQGPAFASTIVGRAVFIECSGAFDPGEATAVAEAVRDGRLFRTRSLHRGTDPDESATLVGGGWWLSSVQA